MKKKFVLILLIFLLFNNYSISAKVKLPAVLGNNMVLQQNTDVLLWGSSLPNSEVTISVSWLNHTVTTVSDANGEWKTNVHTPKAGGPYEITFNDGKDKTVLRNIYMGEVWICSGQSNMEMPVKGLTSQPVFHSNEVIANVNPDWPVRLFTVKKEGSKTLKEDVVGEWKNHTPANVASFSAAAYFFGQQLYRTLRVPIGLIHSSWGASTIESWMSEESLKMYPDISTKHLHADVKVNALTQEIPCLLYNAMLYPLRNVKTSGVIWYQGEANRTRPQQYTQLFPHFVTILRDLFKDPTLPFYYAQIAPFTYADDEVKDYGAQLRESQYICEKKIPHSGMAVLMDLGEPYIIHPSHKIEVGQRFAYLALEKHYGIKGICGTSPRYVSKEVSNGKVTLSFEHAEDGLTSFSKELTNFEVAGADRIFHSATAYIQGDKVVVFSDQVTKPVAVRYAWQNYVVGDLFNIAGLPVSSFRTDF